jgi:hypothetical protein
VSGLALGFHVGGRWAWGFLGHFRGLWLDFNVLLVPLYKSAQYTYFGVSIGLEVKAVLFS